MKRSFARGVARGVLYLCFALGGLLCVAPDAAGQNVEREAGDQREGKTSDNTQQQQRPSSKVIIEPRGFAADNLDRVAATADQILEIVEKDPGMMIELQRMLAQDAGAHGQLLDETDLTEVAINLKLNEDLRSRVLATRLLQRYGYLLPKLNPNSEVGQEHSLYLQERAQQLARAAERGNGGDRNSSQQLTAACEAGQQRNCAGVVNSGRDAGEMNGSGRQGDWPADQTDSPEPQESAPARPSIDGAGRILRADTNSAGSPETLMASLPQNSANGSSAWANRESMATPQIGELPVSNPQNEIYARSREQMGNSSNANSRPENANVREYDHGYARRSASDSAVEESSVRMLHQGNPYADAPSLYDLYVQASMPAERSERFGLDVFRHKAGNPAALPMDLPVGPEYVVGPGDSLSIDLWGGVSQRLFRTVDREGRLLLPEAGPLLVSGKSLGEVQQSVQRVLRTQFRDVSADVSLLRLRSVRVYVVGEVALPGAYDVSSLSTPLNAVFAAGGVTERGSLRRLEHYRGNQRIEQVDLYDLLLHGVRGEAQRLENGDSLRVPPLGSSVTVSGMVRRPATYELRGEKSLAEVLELAGGILPAAALRRIEVQRLEAHQQSTMLSLEIGESSDKDALRTALEKFAVEDGDQVHIFPIAPYNTGAVYLEGHVLRPGRYSYKEGMKLTDLIPSQKELLPEPSYRYAEIIRIVGPDHRPTVESFDLAAAMAHPESAPKLEPLDTVRIFGRFALEAMPEITVSGEVRAPGTYRVSGQEHLRDAIYQAGGMTPETWQDSAQLFRAMNDGTTKVFSVSLRDALAGDPLNNIAVEPRDQILVHRQPEKVNPAGVYVRGEVARPGRYPLTSDMRVSDLVLEAGGLLRSANPTSVDLTHYPAERLAGSNAAVQNEISVNLSAATSGNAEEDFKLSDGDVLTVPLRAGWKDVGALVTIKGEVGKPGVYGIQPGERLSSLLQRAGGLLPTAYPQAAVFERVEVREKQRQSRQELIQRMEQESTVVKAALNATPGEELALQHAEMQQRQRVLEALRNAPVSARLVIHIRAGQKQFANSSDDIELRAGDSLEIPKEPGFIMIVGQVYNSNAITYAPGKNAEWYLSRAGGATRTADKGSIFIIRASGSVTSGKGGMWSGGILSSTLGPGDTIVVPERSVVTGNIWKNVAAIAQIAEAGALAAAVAIP